MMRAPRGSQTCQLARLVTGSTTSSARSRSRASSTSVLPILFSSQSGTEITWRACKSRWPSGSASRGEEPSTMRPAGCAMWWRTISFRSWRCWQWTHQASIAAEDQRSEKVKVFRWMRPLTRDDVVRGQFIGYQSEAGVAVGTDVETYCAARIHIDSWRWDGVSWYIRAGKRLAATATEAIVELNPP